MNLFPQLDNTDTILLSILRAQEHDKLTEDDPDYIIGVTSAYSTDTAGVFKLTIRTFPITIPELHRINERDDVLMPVKELSGTQHLLGGISPEFAEQHKLWTVNPDCDQAGALERATRELENARAHMKSAATIYAMLEAAGDAVAAP